MKKIVPDPPVSPPSSRRNPAHDLANERVRHALANIGVEGSLIATLQPTASGSAGPAWLIVPWPLPLAAARATVFCPAPIRNPASGSVVD
ncbi:hypothetical protein [Pseudomonas sp. BLCC-B112]|uniref:hypothetical protein n=1 Tax=Pseudomonas sp. BLCC-B112 TaxID=3025319 RepID=UPI00234CABC9|nr:hypothetical protein [Pseudomonas sp. BLCC-B112]MDC7813402.1 hypothetical protein [Pseudomonas sp. BLCC-B112]